MSINFNDLINDMECFAKRENIPIMLNDSILYIEDFIKKNNIKSVLEIGTAIGYSTIRIANITNKVVSIERNIVRYNKAVENVSLSLLGDKITLINDDAFNVNISDMFDFIFIDAAKGKNKDFIIKFKNNLSENGFIIIDNVDFHGLVGKSESINSRNLRSLVRKIEEFLKYLDEQDEFVVTKVNVGDGLIILNRR